MPWTVDIREDAIYAMLLALVGILAAWCGLSRRHWFVRFGVVLAVAWLLVPTEAYDPIAYYLLVVGQVMAALALVRAIRHWRSVPSSEASARRVRFSLRDLLLATPLIAAAAGLAALLARQEISWVALLAGCFSGASIVLAATWLVASKRTLVLRALVSVAAIVLSTAVWHYYHEWLNPFSLRVFVPWSDVASKVQMLAYDLAFSAAMFLMVMAGILAVLAGQGKPARRWLLWPARGVTLVLVLVTIPISVFLYCRLIDRRQPPIVHLPNPNGHDWFLRAGKMLRNVPVPEPGTDPSAAFARFAKNNKAALDHARQGLNLPSLLPLSFENGGEWLAQSVNSLQGARQVARAFRAEAVAHADSGDYPSAAQSCVDCIGFAAGWSRGGLLVHWLTAVAIEDMSVEQIKRIRSHLDQSTCRSMITELTSTDCNRERLKDVQMRDSLWSECAYGSAFGWRFRLEEAMNVLLVRESVPNCNWAERQRDALLRLLVSELAVQAYQIERGRPPDCLEDLVPDYLPELPADPCGNAPLRYRWDARSPVVYSVGPDGDDDGGAKLLTRSASAEGADGDLVLDYPQEDVQAAGPSVDDEPDGP